MKKTGIEERVEISAKSEYENWTPGLKLERLNYFVKEIVGAPKKENSDEEYFSRLKKTNKNNGALISEQLDKIGRIGTKKELDYEKIEEAGLKVVNKINDILSLDIEILKKIEPKHRIEIEHIINKSTMEPTNTYINKCQRAFEEAYDIYPDRSRMKDPDSEVNSYSAGIARKDESVKVFEGEAIGEFKKLHKILEHIKTSVECDATPVANSSKTVIDKVLENRERYTGKANIKEVNEIRTRAPS